MEKNSWLTAEINRRVILQGTGFCLVVSVTKHVKYMICIQSEIRVMYLTCPIATGHWTEVESIL